MRSKCQRSPETLYALLALSRFLPRERRRRNLATARLTQGLVGARALRQRLGVRAARCC